MNKDRLAELIAQSEQQDGEWTQVELEEAVHLLAQSMKEQGFGVKRTTIINPDGVSVEHY